MGAKKIIITQHHLDLWKQKRCHCSGACQSCGKQFTVGNVAIQTKTRGSTHWKGRNILHCPEHYYTEPVKEAVKQSD